MNKFTIEQPLIIKCIKNVCDNYEAYFIQEDHSGSYVSLEVAQELQNTIEALKDRREKLYNEVQDYSKRYSTLQHRMKLLEKVVEAYKEAVKTARGESTFEDWFLVIDAEQKLKKYDNSN